MIDLMLYAAFAGFAAFGAAVRTMLGIYKAMNTYPDFVPEWKRIFLEIIFSVGFGMFGVILLQQFNWFPEAPLNVAAAVAGLFGADTIRVVTKKFGLTKGLEVTVSKQQMK